MNYNSNSVLQDKAERNKEIYELYTSRPDISMTDIVAIYRLPKLVVWGIIYNERLKDEK